MNFPIKVHVLRGLLLTHFMHTIRHPLSLAMQNKCRYKAQQDILSNSLSESYTRPPQFIPCCIHHKDDISKLYFFFINGQTWANTIKYHFFYFRLLAETKPLVILTAHRRCGVVDIPPDVTWRSRMPIKLQRFLNLRYCSLGGETQFTVEYENHFYRIFFCVFVCGEP